VFQVFDYLSRLLHEKRDLLAKVDQRGARHAHIPDDIDVLEETKQTSRIQQILDAIPAQIMARRATACGSHERAVYHWEQYLREVPNNSDLDDYRESLQHVYELIDEPDAIEGISSEMQKLNITQQLLDHKQSGRWTAALTHYELEIQRDPEDSEGQVKLLECLKSARQYGR